MVVGTILKFGGLAAGFIFFGLFAKRSAEIGIGPAATEVAQSIGTFGSSLSTLGTGFQGLGTGIGGGISGLFAPFITLFNLFGGGGQATATNNAVKSATQPSTTQQSNTRASKAGSFTPMIQSGGGSSLVSGFLAGPGGL